MTQWYGIWVVCIGPVMGRQEAWAKDIDGNVLLFDSEEFADRKADELYERRRRLSGGFGPSITYSVQPYNI